MKVNIVCLTFNTYFRFLSTMVRPHNFKKCTCKQHFHSKLSLREAITKKNRLNLGKIQNLFYSLPPPFNLGTLNCYFLLHIWALGTLKSILRATYFFPSQKRSDTYIILGYGTLCFSIRT